jgi:hypothetical protein
MYLENQAGQFLPTSLLPVLVCLTFSQEIVLLVYLFRGCTTTSKYRPHLPQAGRKDGAA